MWIDGVRPNLARLAETFDPARMDILLLMAPTTSSIGYAGRGDYAMLPDGALRKRKEHQVVPFVYAGAAIMSPALFADAPAGEFSLTKMFDRANEQERLFGLRLDGVWMHVGTPDAVAGRGRGVSRKRGLDLTSPEALERVSRARSPAQRCAKARHRSASRWADSQLLARGSSQADDGETGVARGAHHDQSEIAPYIAP